MAKLLFTAVVADMRNKLNGTVFSKNRYGAYARTKVTPVNPQSVAQQAARNTLSTNSAAWRGLTEAQRASWTGAAPQFPFSDIYGNSKILSGQALYVKLNGNLSGIGVAPLTVAPSPVGLPAIASVSITAAAGTPAISVVYSIPGAAGDNDLVIEFTPQVGPGISFVKNKYRFLTNIADNAASPFNALTLYNAKFGTLVAGQKVFVRVHLVNANTGQAGIPLSAVAIVAA